MSLFRETFELGRLTEQFSRFAGGEIFIAAGGFCIDSSPYEQERALVKNAVASRQFEFFSGRYYARNALAKAGCLPEMILRAPKGNPIWPKGFLGSITHDQQQAIAVVIREGNIKGIGIDLILNAATVEPHLQSLIATDDELQYLAQAFPAIPPLALAFGAKESVVKAVSPLIDHYLDLLDIHLSLENSSLIATLPKLGFTLSCKIISEGESFISFSVLR